MDPERWKAVEALYHDALAWPLGERAALLEERTSGDPALRSEVESLLDAREDVDEFLSADDLQPHLAELVTVGPTSEQRSIGPYKILSRLGTGAMGEVYRALDTRLERQIALKILPAHFTHDAARVTRFRQEARAASALNHPNIVTIYEIGQAGGTWFIAQELIEGVTVRERMAAEKFTTAEVRSVGLQCASALDAAHRSGILHRDIKPENIMIRPDGVVKVVDFGVARVSETSTGLAGDATQTGTLIGTPRYMSPEQARGRKLDASSDVFSLGAVLFEMVARRPAIQGDTAAEIFADLLAPSAIDTGRGAHEPVLSKALAKVREARYQSMEDFASDLRTLDASATYPAHSSVTTRRRRPAIRRWWLVASSLALAGSAAWFAWMRQSTTRESISIDAVPLTSFAGLKDYGSFSPDGSQIAFSWNGGGNAPAGKPEHKIFAKAVGTDEPRRITSGPEDDRYPAWSPDGKMLAFCRNLSDQFAIYTVRLQDGLERKITEGGPGVSWSADGRELAVAGLASNSGIVRVSLATGEKRQITFPKPYFDSLPVFSPDGKWIAFTRTFSTAAREIFTTASREIFVVPASGGEAKRLTFDRVPTYGSTWTSDSREIVFSSNRGSGGEGLWRISATGGSPRRLNASLQGAFYPSISRSGDRLVYTETYKDTNIYAYDGPGFERRPVPGHFGRAHSLIRSSRRDDSVSISPNGLHIAFVSRRTGNEEIWVCDRLGGNLAKLTSSNGPATGTPRWSPDGRWIAYDSLAGGNSDIYVIPTAGGPPRRLTNGQFSNFVPSWSPDGNWIYFKSDRSGRGEIWKVPFAAGTATQITRQGASEAFASPDGRLLYLRKKAWGPIWSVPVDGGREEPVPELQPYGEVFRSWGILKEGIYFTSREAESSQTIRFFSFATRQVTPLLALEREPVWDYPDLALSPDGRRLLVAFLDHEVNDLMMIEGFR